MVLEKTVEIDGLRVNYSEGGPADGQPVILLHGWGCDHNTVKSISACLEDKLRVISIDLPGHGKTGEPKEVWGTSDFADLIKKITGVLSIENPILIGHSFGGRTSISYASKYPVSKMVLIDSAGIKPKRSLKYYYKVYSYKLWKKIVKSIMGEERGGKIIERMLQKKGSADYRNSSPKMRAIMSRCVNEDLRKIMPSITAPTLLIWGENDTATPIGDAKIMEKNIPDSGVVSFSGCGHYSFLDNPIGFRAVIREFLIPKPKAQKET